MSSIDERIVKMRLDNSQFDQGVNKTSGLLNKLKSSLNLKKAVESINNVGRAVNEVSFKPLASGLQGVQSDFNAMGAVAFSVLNRITNAAIDAGQRIASSMTASIRDGFAEYETQLDSVQTILSNTMSKGTNLDQVNTALDTLNTYADKTIYNFTEMTKNIGTFTAAGVDLQTSVDSIKGIANLAAASGSTSAQAAHAMYQLSQALAAGKIQLMDWNSLVNAGMGGELFQNALKRTAKHLGKDVDGLIKEYGSFRESLTKGEWLTADVMTETLKQISGAYTEADLIGQGYTKKQAEDIVKLANTANDAATKVKTFTQLIDTTKEALGSGWTQSWETIIGDFEESKDLWTGISDQINNIVTTSANARNELLSSGLSSGWKQLLSQGIADTAGFQEIMTQTARDHGVAIDDMIAKNGSFTKSMHEGWVTADIVTESVQKMTDKMSKMSKKKLQAAGYTSENVEQIKKLNEQLQNGSLSAQDFADKMNRLSGRENIISGLNNVFSDLSKVFERIGKSYREVFPKMTGDELYTLTKRFKDFTDALTPSEKTLDRIGSISKNVFSSMNSIFGDLFAIFKQIDKAYKETFSKNAKDGLSTLDSLTKRFKDFTDALTPSEKTLNRIGRISKNVFSSMNSIFGDLFAIFKQIGKAFEETFKETFSKNAKDALSTLDSLTKRFNNFVKTLTPSEKTLDRIGRIAKGVFAVFDIGFQAVKAVGEAISSAFGSTNMSGPMDNLLDIAARFGDWLVGLDESIKQFGIFDTVARRVGNAISNVIDSFNSFSEKVSSTGSVVESVASTIGNALGNAFDHIKNAVSSVVTWIKDNVSVTDIFAGLAGGGIFLAAKKIGGAFDKIKETIENLFDKGGDTLKKGAGVFEDVLSGLSDSLSAFTKNIKAATLIEISTAISLLVNSMEKISELGGDDIVRGTVTIANLMTELDLSLKAFSKSMKSVKTSDLLRTGLALIEFSKAVEMLADTMDTIGKLNWDEIGKGLTGIAGAMIELAVVSRIMNRVKVNIRTAASLIATAQAVKMVADPLKKLGSMSWGNIGKGLSAMGGALFEMSTVTGLLGRFGKKNISAAVSMVITAKSLGDIADAFDSFSKHSWEDIGKGLVAMGGALTEVGLMSGALGKIAGLSGLLGAGTILLAVQGLDNLASAFDSFSKYNWDEIGRGLVAMGGAMGEVALISGATGVVTGIAGLVGAGTITLASQGLDDIASAFDSFSKKSWDEIGRGLVAMGGALAEVAVITGATGVVAGIAGLVGAGTITLASQGLDDIATVFGKFAENDWDGIGRGLAAMGGALGEIGAIGVVTGIAGLVGAGTITLASQGLDDIATAFGKFAENDWDEIGRGLIAMGDALGEIALGGLLNTLSVFGALSISEMAGSLGVLADSVKKWEDVSLPSDLAIQLGRIADGVMKFTLDGWGGATVANIAEPMGVLADSLSKWSTITFPEGISEQLSSLSKGIESFTWAFAGGWSIGSVVEPFGQFADAVGKWKGVYVPAGINAGLESLSKGIESFTWAFAGGWSMSDTVDPLSGLADSMRKWKGVYIPDGIDTGLENLSKGVKSFTWAFAGGWSLSAVTGPLGDLGDAARKWNGVKIPDGIDTAMEKMADGVKKFEGIGSDAYNNLFNVTQNVNRLYNSVLAFKQIDLPGTANSINSFVCRLNSMQAVTSTLPDQISDFATKLGTSLTSLGSTVSSSSASIVSAFSSLRSQVSTAISGLRSIVSSNIGSSAAAVYVGANMISSGSNSIGAAFGRMASIARSQMAIFSNTVSLALTETASEVQSSAPRFRLGGVRITKSFINGLNADLNGIPTIFNSVMTAAESNIRSFRDSFYSAGVYVADGFASGINSQIAVAALAAEKLANTAFDAAKDALDIHSPSKVFGWIGKMTVDGFVNKINEMETDARKSGYSMAESVINGFNEIDMSNISEPSIRPVMDLSMIRRQTSDLSSMMNVSTNPIKADLDFIGRLESQNGVDYQTEVLNRLISATDKNAKELSDLRSDISRYNDSIAGQETAVYVDGKKLASSIAKPMNQQLGIRSRRGSLSRT